MNESEFFPDSTEFYFPADSLFKKGKIAENDIPNDQHIHSHTLRLQLKEAVPNEDEINALFGSKLGNEADEIQVTLLSLSSSANPREVKYDRVVVEGSQRIVNNLLMRLGAHVGNPSVVDSLRESTSIHRGRR